ncbi:hypothetical protein AGIG_G24698 [Arapaima gigas]
MRPVSTLGSGGTDCRRSASHLLDGISLLSPIFNLFCSLSARDVLFANVRERAGRCPVGQGRRFCALHAASRGSAAALCVSLEIKRSWRSARQCQPPLLWAGLATERRAAVCT